MAKDYSISALAEGIRILDLVCEEARPVSLGEMALALQISKNRAFRAVRTLEMERLLIKAEDGYGAGPHLGEWWGKYRVHLWRRIEKGQKIVREAQDELAATEIPDQG